MSHAGLRNAAFDKLRPSRACRGTDCGLRNVAAGLRARLCGYTRRQAGRSFVVETTRILTNGENDNVSLRDLQPGRLLQRFGGQLQSVTDFAVSPDGQYAVSGSYDGIIRLWKLPERVRSKKGE